MGEFVKLYIYIVVLFAAVEHDFHILVIVYITVDSLWFLKYNSNQLNLVGDFCLLMMSSELSDFIAKSSTF